MNNNLEVSRLLAILSVLIGKNDKMSYQSEAYQKAANGIQRFEIDLCSVKDWHELTPYPYIGEYIAKDIVEYCKTGRFKYLENILMKTNPLDILQFAEGVEKSTAERIVEALNINTFDDLLRDFENKRIEAFIDKRSDEYLKIAELLNFLPSWLTFKNKEEKILKEVRPSTLELLRMDEYFRNHFPYPENKIKKFSKKYGEGYISVSYSDSEHARKLRALGDWVNVIFAKNGHYLKWVILTSRFGKQKGKRIVMGENQKYPQPLSTKENQYQNPVQNE